MSNDKKKNIEEIEQRFYNSQQKENSQPTSDYITFTKHFAAQILASLKKIKLKSSYWSHYAKYS
jgi:hypothetical protein